MRRAPGMSAPDGEGPVSVVSVGWVERSETHRTHSRVTNYRRNFLPGGSYFFTVNLAERRLALLTERIDLLRAAFRSVRARHPFTIEAAVVLPDHLHMIWTLPDGDPDFPSRWRVDQERFFASSARRRTDLSQPRCQGRARDLAAAVLGAHPA